MVKLLLAPIQGITDFNFRNTFLKYFGGIDEVYSPYLRLDNKRELKKSKVKDVLPENNLHGKLVSQIMTNNADDFLYLTEFLSGLGYNHVNWNLGCPFPMVTNRKLGSGLLPFNEQIDDILYKVFSTTDMKISIKMRMGYENKDEIFEILPRLNKYPIPKIIIHPRTAKQMYKGNVILDDFRKYLEISDHEICYNGDINSVNDYNSIQNKFPEVNQWMLGRGIIANPFLAMQIKEINTPEDKKKHFFEFHNELVDLILNQTSGSSHLLSKMRAYWEYFALSFTNSHKVFKLIKKSKNISGFNSAISSIIKNEDFA